METIEELVLQTLNENINTRFSDNILYLEVIYKIKPYLRDLDFKTIFINYSCYGIPSIKTVERARRKLEQKGLYVSPKNIKEERENMIQKYLDYAMN